MINFLEIDVTELIKAYFKGHRPKDRITENAFFENHKMHCKEIILKAMKDFSESNFERVYKFAVEEHLSVHPISDVFGK